MYKPQIYQIAESNRIETFCPNWNALLCTKLSLCKSRSAVTTLSHPQLPVAAADVEDGEGCFQASPAAASAAVAE